MQATRERRLFNQPVERERQIRQDGEWRKVVEWRGGERGGWNPFAWVYQDVRHGHWLISPDRPSSRKAREFWVDDGEEAALSLALSGNYKWLGHYFNCCCEQCESEAR